MNNCVDAPICGLMGNFEAHFAVDQLVFDLIIEITTTLRPDASPVGF